MADIVAAAVVSPLSDADAASDIERVSKVDSNAVQSAFPRLSRLVGRWLTTADGAASLGCRFAQFSVLFAAAMHGLDYGAKGDAKFVRLEWDELSSGCQTLMYVSAFGQCVAYGGVLLPLAAVHRATKAGGELDELGAGTVMIAASDARSLRIWNTAITAVAGLAVCVAAFWLALSVLEGITGTFLLNGVGGATDPSALSVQYKISMALLIGQMGPATAGFWVSMMTASALARDALTEVQHAVINGDPRDKASWDRDVAAPTLALDVTMRLLSRGWGGGLLGLSICCWGMAVNALCRGINTEYSFEIDHLKDQPEGTERLKVLRLSVFLMLLPLLLMLEVAVRACHPAALFAPLCTLSRCCGGCCC